MAAEWPPVEHILTCSAEELKSWCQETAQLLNTVPRYRFTCVEKALELALGDQGNLEPARVLALVLGISAIEAGVMTPSPGTISAPGRVMDALEASLTHTGGRGVMRALDLLSPPAE